MYYGINEPKYYQKNLNENINSNNIQNNNILNSKNINENNNNNFDFNNKYQFQGFLSNSMINQRNKIEPLISHNSQLLSSFPNNIQYQFDIQNKTLEAKNNLINDYYYKYSPNNNNYNSNKDQNNSNKLFISDATTTNQINNINKSDQILSSNIMTSPKNKNISLNSQISQEIDRQKLKFDEMVEKAKNLNNSENFEFDLKKYLPKESIFENSKALRKYKDLIKPSNSNRYNNYFSSRNNFGKNIQNKDKYDDIKDNTLSEIPIKNDNIFEDELSKSELDFNIQSPCKDNNNNIDKDNDKNHLKQNNQDNLKQNLLENLKDNKINTKNNKINNKAGNNLNNIINNSPNNSDICFRNDLNNNDEHINSNVKDENNNKDYDYKSQIPFYPIYYEKINYKYNDDNTNNKDEYNENNFNEIEKTNIDLDKSNKNINHINNYSWHCLDFFDDNQEKIYLEFFNNDKI